MQIKSKIEVQIVRMGVGKRGKISANFDQNSRTQKIADKCANQQVFRWQISENLLTYAKASKFAAQKTEQKSQTIAKLVSFSLKTQKNRWHMVNFVNFPRKKKNKKSRTIVKIVEFFLLKNDQKPQIFAEIWKFFGKKNDKFWPFCKISAKMNEKPFLTVLLSQYDYRVREKSKRFRLYRST